MSHGGWHCHPVCWAASQHKSAAAQGTRWQPHPAEACSAGPWRQQRQATTLAAELGVCPHWCGCQFSILGGKTQESPHPVCGSFLLLFLLGAGSSSQGWGGFCPVCWALWVLGVYRLTENTCRGWAAASPLVPRENDGGNKGEVEGRREGEQFVFLHKHLWLVCSSCFVLLWDVVKRGILLPSWQRSCGHGWWQMLLLTHWQRLVLNFWHWLSAPKSCCFVSVHSSVMGKPLRKGKEVSSCTDSFRSFVHKNFLG